MSAALNAAKKRRGVQTTTAPPQFSAPQYSTNPYQTPGNAYPTYSPNIGATPIPGQPQFQQQPSFQQPGQPGMPPSPPQGAAAGAGLTLQQVIQVVDRRLINLEDFAKKNADLASRVNNGPVVASNVPENLTEVLDEYNSRFDILAEEIANLKNVVLNLQSYTMDVNKMLLKERIHILSGDGNASEQVDAETTTDLDTKSMANLSLGGSSIGASDMNGTFNFYAN